MSMDAPAAQSPALLGREDLIRGTDAPFGDGLDAVLGGAKQRDAAGSAGKQTTQALRDEAKNLVSGSAGLKETPEFADLGDFGRLAAGIGEQATDLLVGGGQLVLRFSALSDFLLLVELGQGQPKREGEE
jgi:hypothetical protein